MKLISEIKKELSEVNIAELPRQLEVYSNDERKGVKNLIAGYHKKYLQYTKELERIKGLNSYENRYYEKGYQLIAGIDEVGRGPLAGPVLAACAILPRDCVILGIDDSKKLSAQKRAELFIEIKNKALYISVGMVSPQMIDKINIRQATLQAMAEAVAGLGVQPGILLVDGLDSIPCYEGIEQEIIVGGDGKSISIAAASIIAKVTRDNMMKEFANIYKEYHFASNKGYGSKEHMQAIEKYGPCPIHRKTFLKGH